MFGKYKMLLYLAQKLRDMNIIKQCFVKSYNKRIEILLFKEDDEFIFAIATKRLVDFKTRNIRKTETFYSVESFIVIAEILKIEFLDDSLIINKLLKKDINKFKGVNIEVKRNSKYY